ncbi:MAG: 6-phosphogluconolactonase [Pseudomonadota bacterium]
MIELLEFSTREAASVAAASRMSECIQTRLDTAERAEIVVSGGSTPQRCFAALADTDLDWPRVRVALSDERWVPADHDASNEGMVRNNLLQGRAASTSLLHIYQSDMTVDERCDSLQSELEGVEFACALVGMGADGHFASLFPDADALAVGLHRDTQHFYIPIKTGASPHPRVSMTLAALLRSDELVLLFFGDDKKVTFEQAVEDRDAYPIGHLIHQSATPVRGYWAP